MRIQNARRWAAQDSPQWSRDSGFATAEFAVATPAIVLVLMAVLGTLQAVAVHHQALHAASVGARVAARGEPQANVVKAVETSGLHGGSVTVNRAGSLATVRVVPRIPSAVSWALPDLSADVSALVEEGLAEGVPE